MDFNRKKKIITHKADSLYDKVSGMVTDEKKIFLILRNNFLRA